MEEKNSFRWCPKRRKGGDIAQAGQRIPVGSCHKEMTYDPCKRKYSCEFYDVAIAKEATAKRKTERAGKAVDKILKPFAQRMEEAKTTDEGREIIAKAEIALGQLQKEAGQEPTVGPGGSGFQWRGFSTLKAREKKAITKDAPEEFKKRLAELVADIEAMESYWKRLLEKETAKQLKRTMEPASKTESKPQPEKQKPLVPYWDDGRPIVHYWRPGHEDLEVTGVVHYGLEDRMGTLCGLEGTTRTCQKPEDFKLCKRCEARS